MQAHQIYIKRCLELAELGKGATAPNPMVGAVLVHNGRVIGEGWHQQYGQAHAEVNCLQNVLDVDKHLIPESTMYVSLEPCAHQGKTPSCALRLIKEKVKEVIVCNSDPFEMVGGKGFQLLQEQGIATLQGILEEDGNWLNRRFFCFHQQKRPYIILKWAQTQAGFFAPLDGSRLQMSNRFSQQLVHRWRTEEGAILVGYHTALKDDPELTSRLWQGNNPIRIFIDQDLKIPASHKLYNNQTTTWVINATKDEQTDHIHFIKLDFGNQLLQQILSKLQDANILSLIVEGGANLLQQFIELGLWDEARVFVTPNVLSEGLKAPQLQKANLALSTVIVSDTLHLWVNQESKYPYINRRKF